MSGKFLPSLTAAKRAVLSALAVVAVNGTVPATAQDTPAERVVMRYRASTGCQTEVIVNGRLFSMTADSGATGEAALVFGRNHARALGFDPHALQYRVSYTSANGDGWSARVILRSVRLQSFVMYDVPADITEADQSDPPTLGAAILHKLHFEMGDGYCRLTLPE
jgi:clan AA aspartic protease (TIGR02281 family)